VKGTRFAYNAVSGNGNSWADLNTTNQVVTRREYLDAIDTVFARIGSGGAEDWYLGDHLGSVRGLQNNNGTFDDALTYNPFGTITTETQPSNGDRVKYGGYQFDATTGMFYVMARWYDPVTTRWVSQDLEGLGPDTNLYRYVGNEPTDATDPSGNKPARKKSKLVVNGQPVQGPSSNIYRNVLRKTAKFKKASVVKEILNTMIKSPVEDRPYRFQSTATFVKAITLRLNVIAASEQLWKLQKAHRHVFSRDKVRKIVEFPRGKNWRAVPLTVMGKIQDRFVTRDIVGIAVKNGKKPSAAINGLFNPKNFKPGKAQFVEDKAYYACFTAVYLAILKGILTSMGPKRFDALFASKDDPKLVLASTYGHEPFLNKSDKQRDQIPGDLRTFTNPGSIEASLRDENTIYLGNGRYFAPFIGIKTEKGVRKFLNKRSSMKKAYEEGSSQRPKYPSA
jgi:RHS repeat-associated protein